MVYFRYARYFAKSGYDVILLCMQASTNVDNKDEDSFITKVVLKSETRMGRYLLSPLYVRKYCSHNCCEDDTFIFFSVDLLPVALQLKRRKGVRIVQVFAENYPLKIATKAWIPEIVKKRLAKLLFEMQSKVMKKALVNVFVDKATFLYYHAKMNSIVLPNYPIMTTHNRVPYQERHSKMVYVGGVSITRGLKLMATISRAIDCDIDVYGRFENAEAKEYLNSQEKLHYRGFIAYDEVLATIEQYKVGLALFNNDKGFSYIGENTTKIFEYMEAGLPIITTDVGRLKDIIENETQTGIAVSTEMNDVDREMIREFINNDDRMLACSMRGRDEFKDKRNWETRFNELIARLSEEQLNRDE